MRDWGDPMEMRAMLDAGLTKKAAAKRLGVDRRTLSRWQAEARAGCEAAQAQDSQAGSLQGDHPRAAARLTRADGAALVRRGPRRRDTRGRSISARSGRPGASATRWSWCWATRGSCGASSIPGRRWRRRCWTGSCTGATWSTSRARATACGSSKRPTADTRTGWARRLSDRYRGRALKGIKHMSTEAIKLLKVKQTKLPKVGHFKLAIDTRRRCTGTTPRR